MSGEGEFWVICDAENFGIWSGGNDGVVDGEGEVVAVFGWVWSEESCGGFVGVEDEIVGLGPLVDGVEVWLEVGFCGAVVLVGRIGVHVVGVCV